MWADRVCNYPAVEMPYGRPTRAEICYHRWRSIRKLCGSTSRMAGMGHELDKIAALIKRISANTHPDGLT